MYLVQIITERAAEILSQPLPPIPQNTGPNWGQFALNAGFALLWSVVAAIIFAIVLAVGMRVYNMLTPGINEIKELEAGNTAVGLTMSAFILAITGVVIAILTK